MDRYTENTQTQWSRLEESNTKKICNIITFKELSASSSVSTIQFSSSLIFILSYGVVRKNIFMTFEMLFGSRAQHSRNLTFPSFAQRIYAFYQCHIALVLSLASLCYVVSLIAREIARNMKCMNGQVRHFSSD